MDEKLTYLDSYILQKDMRIRMPKSIISNLGVERGNTKFDIFLDQENQRLVLVSQNITQIK
ncbi:hypothetical protein H0A38_06610 [Lactococcus lactis]|uniref:AbrB/MazE/SpoVT family DNA-binding domain-containing protein n=1 Tax=Lactococcus lactis TaxID=1358 RepID=UPI001CF38B7C|nr:AbrB/MazE/SpoVT family DNA-binding domain-containing protein [Lactococcus lactis]UCS89367.1 hypothetical protein H0A38_06610 [Lactococcus lactis]